MKKKHWPNDSTYLAYVHSQLYELAILACLYYHECCVGIPPHALNITGSNSPEQASLATSTNASLSTTSPPSLPASAPFATAHQSTLDSSTESLGSHRPVNYTLPNLNLLNSISSMEGLQPPSISMSLGEVNLKYAEREQTFRQQQLLAQQNQKTNTAKQNFFKRNHIKENDAEILQYFAEVVKMQQSATLRGVKKSSIIKLDYSQVFQFENPKRGHIFPL